MQYIGMALLDENGIVLGKMIYSDGFPDWTDPISSAIGLSRFISSTFTPGRLQLCVLTYRNHKIIVLRRQSKLYAAVLINSAGYEVEKAEIDWLKTVPLKDIRRICLYHDILN